MFQQETLRELYTDMLFQWPLFQRTEIARIIAEVAMKTDNTKAHVNDFHQIMAVHFE